MENEIINKIIEIGARLGPGSGDDPEEIRAELRDMLRTASGCREIINSLLDTIKGLMEG